MNFHIHNGSFLKQCEYLSSVCGSFIVIGTEGDKAVDLALVKQ